MNGFDPGDGWRKTDSLHDAKLVEYGADDEILGMWVREEPVPALPTVPYTVIRPHWDTTKGSYSDDTLTLGEDGKWGPSWASSTWVQQRITGFEVLSEPRAAIANAVLDRVRKVHHSAGDLSIPARFRNELDYIARDYGVDQ